MIISRTPFRVSLFGGGSDYPAWYREHGGRVLGMAIDKYCYITVRELPPFFEHRHRIVHSKIELVERYGDIQHPAVRAILESLSPEHGIEFHHDGDLPARSGLGSSSSFTVGMINSLTTLMGKSISKKQLAETAIDIEQNVIDVHVGSQDQIWATYGGLNRISFHSNGSFDVASLGVSRGRRAELIGKLLLFFSGHTRYAPEIAKKQIANLSKRKSHIFRMMEMVDEAEAIFANDTASLSEIGELLHQSWLLKKDLADGISTTELDDIYDAGRRAGAVGGKLLGAGGGGFMLFYVEPQNQADVRNKLSPLVQVKFNIDDEGSRIVLDNSGHFSEPDS